MDKVIVVFAFVLLIAALILPDASKSHTNTSDRTSTLIISTKQEDKIHTQTTEELRMTEYFEGNNIYVSPEFFLQLKQPNRLKTIPI